MISCEIIMSREVVLSGPEALSMWNAKFAKETASQAKKVLTNIEVKRADFSFADGNLHTYCSFADLGGSYKTLVMQSNHPDQIIISHNVIEELTTLSYVNTDHGWFFLTTLAEDRSGKLEIRDHYTNAPASYADILDRAKDGLRYAERNLAKR